MIDPGDRWTDDGDALNMRRILTRQEVDLHRNRSRGVSSSGRADTTATTTLRRPQATRRPLAGNRLPIFWLRLTYETATSNEQPCSTKSNIVAERTMLKLCKNVLRANVFAEKQPTLLKVCEPRARNKRMIHVPKNVFHFILRQSRALRRGAEALRIY